MKKIQFILLIAISYSMLLLNGCQKDNNAEGTGHLIIKVTDAPFPIEYVEEALVRIIKVEVREKNSEDGYPFLTLMEDTVTIDLIDLRNGVTAVLLETDVPVGEYDLVRLYVDHAGITIKDWDTYFMKVPSGAQTGIKIFMSPSIRVEGGLTSELLLDFDISKSFVLKGNMFTPAGIKGFNFKPVIRAVNNTTAGRVEGVVSDTANVLLEDASVWIEKDTVISTTYTDSIGQYALIGIPAGSYSVFATKEGYDTVAFSDIEIYAGNKTLQDFELTPIE